LTEMEFERMVPQQIFPTRLYDFFCQKALTLGPTATSTNLLIYFMVETVINKGVEILGVPCEGLPNSQ